MDARCIQLGVHVAVYLEFDGSRVNARPVSSSESQLSGAILSFLSQILTIFLYNTFYVSFES